MRLRMYCRGGGVYAIRLVYHIPYTLTRAPLISSITSHHNPALSHSSNTPDSSHPNAPFVRLSVRYLGSHSYLTVFHIPYPIPRAWSLLAYARALSGRCSSHSSFFHICLFMDFSFTRSSIHPIPAFFGPSLVILGNRPPPLPYLLARLLTFQLTRRKTSTPC